MNRVEALAYLTDGGFARLMKYAGRAVDDSVSGYKPALDRAFRAFGVPIASLPAASVLSSLDEAFGATLRAVTYDLILPYLATFADSSVDAPLTNVKASQIYRQVREMRDDAWAEAGLYGYGPINVGYATLALDIYEPLNLGVDA